MLHKSCVGFEGCHAGFGATPDAMFKSLVNAPATRERCWQGVLVAPGDPGQSYLVHKLLGVGMCPNTRRMPTPNGIPAADVQTIVDWICQGAKSD